MFIIRWIRAGLSLPLQWLGQLAGWTKVGLDVPLLTGAWWISGDGRVACQVLQRLYSTRGRDLALLQAHVWMQRAPRREIAGMGGLMALEQGQVETAQELLRAGQEIGRDDEGLLELLEWHLTIRSGDDTAIQTLTRRFESRRDLPPSLRRMVLCTLMWDAMRQRRFAEADRQAKYLLDIYCDQLEAGKAAQEADQWEKAQACCSQALAINPWSMDARALRASARMQMKQYEAAREDLDEAIRLSPKTSELYSMRAIVHGVSGHSSEMQEDLATYQRLKQPTSSQPASTHP